MAIVIEEYPPILIAIVLYHDFTALDAIGPYEVLHILPNATIKFVSHRPGPVSADLGMLFVNASASFLDVRRPDIIIVPGGPNTIAVLKDEPLLNWIRKAHETTLYTTSVCTGSLILGAAGLLNGLEATTHWRVCDELAKLGAIPVSKRFVQQGKIITAAGVSAGIDMAIQLAAILRGKEIAKAIQLILEYDPQPPYDVGNPSKSGEEQLAKTNQLFINMKGRSMMLDLKGKEDECMKAMEGDIKG